MPKHKPKKPEVIDSSEEKEIIIEKPEKNICYKNYHCNHCSNGSFWGIIFILAGLTFILNNMGLIPWSFWNNLWHFWPILLILFGIRILIGCTPGSNLIMGFITALTVFSVWVKILIDINSPLVNQWGLNQLPWFNFLINLKIY